MTKSRILLITKYFFVFFFCLFYFIFSLNTPKVLAGDISDCPDWIRPNCPVGERITEEAPFCPPGIGEPGHTYKKYGCVRLPPPSCTIAFDQPSPQTVNTDITVRSGLLTDNGAGIYNGGKFEVDDGTGNNWRLVDTSCDFPATSTFRPPWNCTWRPTNINRQVGTHTVRLTVKDAAGVNSNSCTATYTLTSIQAPVSPPPGIVVPNCYNLNGSTSIVVGQTGAFSADFRSLQGELRGGVSIGQNGTIVWSPSGLGKYFGATAVSGNSTFTWGPTAPGSYDVFCRAWNDGLAECRGLQSYVDIAPRSRCVGLPSTPTSKTSMTVVVSSPAACPRKKQGDANCDGLINTTDYSIWRQEFTGGLITKTADFNDPPDNAITTTDYSIWRQNFVSSQ